MKVKVKVTEVTHATIEIGDLKPWMVRDMMMECEDVGIWDLDNAEVISTDVEIEDLTPVKSR